MLLSIEKLDDYIPSDSPNIALQEIRQFFLTEKDVCTKTKEIANILTSNQEKFAKTFKDIEKVIQLYNNLSINFFEVINVNTTKVPSIEDWISAIFKEVNSPGYQQRLQRLKDSTVNYPSWNKTIAQLIENTDFPDTEKNFLKLHFSIPIHRILRMKMQFIEISKHYTGNNKETAKQLEQLVEIFGALANYLNASVGNSDKTKKEISSKHKRHAKSIEKAVVDHIQANENSNKDVSFFKLFQNGSENFNDLTLTIILRELKKITLDAKDQLIKLEHAFGEIKKVSHALNQESEIKHFFRKKFPFTDAQLKQIALLKVAYLTIVANTPKEEDSDFERYLERQYPTTATAEIGGLLAFNTTCFSWFIKKNEKTTSMKQLESLKAGIGRVNPDHQINITGKIAAFGKVVY